MHHPMKIFQSKTKRDGSLTSGLARLDNVNGLVRAVVAHFVVLGLELFESLQIAMKRYGGAGRGGRRVAVRKRAERGECLRRQLVIVEIVCLHSMCVFFFCSHF